MGKQGKVFAFKTDTVWGFGCHPLDFGAVDKIYQIKQRDAKKPLILMSDDFEFLKKYIKEVPDYAYELIKKYLPGALTLIFEKSEICPPNITSGGNTIGIRIPNSVDFFNLIKKIDGRVLATTSCNLSNEEPVKNYSEAKEKFGNLATIIKPIEDVCCENIPSTVVLCNKNGYQVLRQGKIIL